MTRSRRAAVAFSAIAAGVLVLVTAGGAAAATSALPQAGPLNPAFVEALRDPIAGALGKLPDPVNVEVGPAVAARMAQRAEALPSDYASSYDLRHLTDANGVTYSRLNAVRDQGSFGTCWAFANIAALESELMPAERWEFSEDNLVTRSGFGPFGLSGVAKRWQAYDYGGWDFMAVAYFARWAGPVTEKSDPYETPTPPTVNHVVKHVQGAVMYPGRPASDDSDTANGVIKQLVYTNGALSVGMFWNDDFATSSGSGYYCPYAANDSYDGETIGENHGVAIVGWNDAYPAASFTTSAGGTPAGDGAFLVRNSWGKGFGEGGYFWVSYYDRSFARDECTSYSDVEAPGNYRRVYQYDKLGWTSAWGMGGKTECWGANRFTAHGNGHIAAAGFYTRVAGTRYEIYAGSTFKTLKLRASGTSSLPGYATVKLTAPLAVTAGRRFVVAVHLVSPGTTAADRSPIAIENPATRWMAGAVARPGQSFMSLDGRHWTDLNADKPSAQANVCLKAFATK